MTDFTSDLRCFCCERGDDDIDPLLEAWVGKDVFWTCRSCVDDWLAAVWHRRGAAA
jgi:hypothetical protein